MLNRTTDFYYCKNRRRIDESCPSMLKVIKTKQTGIINVFSNQKEHVHAHQKGLSNNVKEEMALKLKQGYQPAQIRDSLLHEIGVQAPTLIQVQNFVMRQKAKEGLNNPMNVYELTQHCNENSAQSDDIHAPFIIGSRISEDGGHFLICWSTLALIQRQHSSKLILDGTYKLTTAGYPCLRAGFADANGRFHSTFIAIARTEDTQTYQEFFTFIAGKEPTYLPEIIMADGDKSITAAQRIVWPMCDRATCFFHMIKNQKEKMKKGRLTEFWPTIKSELNTIALATSFPEFAKAARVLNSAWADRFQNDVEMRGILATFVEQYIVDESNSGWWAGFSPECPRTNNGLEAANKQLKARATDWRRQPLRQFLITAADHVHLCSIAPEYQNPAQRPDIRHEIFRAAFELKKECRPFAAIRSIDDITQIVLIPSAAGIASFGQPFNTQILVDAFTLLESNDEDQHPFQNWEHYKTLRHQFHVIKRCQNWPDFFMCNCYAAANAKPCKHSVFVMCLPDVNLLQYPPAVASQQLQPNRKRGRPKKIGPALMQT